MAHAVIKTGGKQYLVSKGDRLKVDRLAEEEGKAIVFSDILLTSDKETVIGAPLVSGASVKAKVIRHGRHAKVMGVKMKAKKRQRTLFGHKQDFTEVEITDIKQK